MFCIYPCGYTGGYYMDFIPISRQDFSGIQYARRHNRRNKSMRRRHS